MYERDIVISDVTKPGDLYQLKEYLRELYSLFSPRNQTVTFAASITADVDLAETFFVTLTGNITSITIKNADTGRKLRFVFLQDGTGSRTVTGWPATVLLSGAAFTITSTANVYSTISFEYINSKWIEIGRTTDVR